MADLGYAPHVPGRMAMVMQASCDVAATTDQSITCQVVANKCDNLKYNCSNVAVVDYSCTSLQQFAELGALVLSAEPPQVKETIDRKHFTKTTETITQSIQQILESACGTVSAATQTLDSTLQCTNSSNLVLTVLNTMDATAACVTLQIASMVADARADLVKPQIPQPPLSNPMVIAAALGGAAVLGVAAMVAIWKL